jgi:DNA-binding transcriptional ArsR family regulator
MEREEMIKLAQEFEDTTEILTAIGNDTRQKIILTLMNAQDQSGMRVEEIASKTFLSRPAVSHHLQILKHAGIIKMRKEGTKNFYYFDDTGAAIEQLIQTLTQASVLVHGKRA